MQVLDHIHAFLWKSVSANNCNTYLINGPKRILIDPGHISLFEHVKNHLAELKLDLSDIGLVLCTHVHPDHVEAVQLFHNEPAFFTIHESEWRLVKSMTKYLQSSGVRLEAYTPDFFIREGELNVSGLAMQIFHTPGHSPDSVCIYLPEFKALFTGDLIFKDGFGRTDLPGGNSRLLVQSIQKMAQLDIETVLPGHGDIISGADNVKHNFLNIERYV